ncbi:uncharacterized protein V6R79_010013 [Siganus canaliculatus]
MSPQLCSNQEVVDDIIVSNPRSTDLIHPLSYTTEVGRSSCGKWTGGLSWLSTCKYLHAAHAGCLLNHIVVFKLLQTQDMTGLFNGQCELVPVMGYSQTDANLSRHSQNSIPPS